MNEMGTEFCWYLRNRVTVECKTKHRGKTDEKKADVGESEKMKKEERQKAQTQRQNLSSLLKKRRGDFQSLSPLLFPLKPQQSSLVSD